MKRFFAIFSILGIFTFSFSQTNIPAGEVFGKWDTGGSPYLIMGNIFISEDSTLSIDPGVKIEFQGHYELKVMGSLLAEGNESDSIKFTVNDTTGFSNLLTTEGGWYGVRIYDINEDSDSTKLSYCIFEYGKAIGSGWFLNSGGALCIISFDKVAISNCTFQFNIAGGPEDSSPAGGAVHLAWSDVHFKDNIFENNYAYAGGAIQFHESNPVFENNIIQNNHCVWDGGGISSGGGSNPVFSGDIIKNNTSEQLGGGITFWEGNDINIDKVIVKQNTANWGGGLGFIGCEAEIKDSEISQNYVTWLGGGMAADHSIITVKNSNFEKDTSLSHAGAIHTWKGTLKVKNSGFKDNAGENGGALYVDFSTLEVDSSSFLNNFAQSGGAIHVYNGNLEVDSCTFKFNEAQNNGGAIVCGADSLFYDSLYSVNILNSQFLENKANAAGGFTVEQYHMEKPLLNLLVDNCMISNNRAHHVGGFRIIRCISSATISNSIVSGNVVEAWTAGGNITSNTNGKVYNCLFSGNQSATVNSNSSSGGLGITTDSYISVFNNTFVNNSAGVGGGLMLYRGGDAVIANNIFWGNSPDQVALNAIIDTLECVGTFNNNNIQFGLDSIHVNDTVSKVNWGTGNINEDPLFTGPSNGDFSLQAQSPAIGIGTDSIEVENVWYYSPELDIEGKTRPAPLGSMPDLGAYEEQNSWPLAIFDEFVGNQDLLNPKIYPNPFSTKTTIEFHLSERTEINIKVFNLLGVQISTILSSDLESGKHQVDWMPKQIKNGLYFLQIQSKTEAGIIYEANKRIFYVNDF